MKITEATDRQIASMKRFWEETPDHPPQRLLTASLLKRDFLSLIARLEKAEAVFVEMDEEDRAPTPKGMDEKIWRKADEIFHATALVANDSECVKIIYAGLAENDLDAARYRWVRDPSSNAALVLDKVSGEVPYDEGTQTGGYLTYEYRSGEELDAAIDAARGILTPDP